MRVRSLVFGLLGAVAALSVGSAVAKPLAAFTSQNITPILQAAGATELVPEVVEGSPRITFKLGDRTYVADLYECEDKAVGCKLLQFVLAFEPNAGDTLAAVNSFNDTFIYGKAALAKDGGLLSMRMINGNAGSSDEQVMVELAAFVGVTDLLLDHMTKNAVTAAVPGGKVATLAHYHATPSAKHQTYTRNKRPVQ